MENHELQIYATDHLTDRAGHRHGGRQIRGRMATRDGGHAVRDAAGVGRVRVAAALSGREPGQARGVGVAHLLRARAVR